MTNLVEFPGLGLELTINRVAFTIGDMPIYWYGVIIAAGLLLAVVFGMHYAPDFGIDKDRFMDVILIGGVLAIVCARAYYVIFAPFKYESLWDMINLRDGGLAIYGAVIGAAVFGGLACRWRRLPLLRVFDVVGMGFLIGQGMGRWGNFFNQEAFGTNTTLPWGMYSAATRSYLERTQAELAAQGVMVDPTLPVHPTFLYESIWCFVGLALLWRHMKKRRFDGELALWYAAWYGAGRFWIEGLRTDSLMTPFFGLRVSQVVALVSVVVSLILLVLGRRRFAGREYRIPLAVDLTKQAAWARAWKAHTGEEWVPAEADSLPASASHAEFVAATKQMNDRFDLSRIEAAVKEWQAAQTPAEAPAPEEPEGEQNDGGTDH